MNFLFLLKAEIMRTFTLLKRYPLATALTVIEIYIVFMGIFLGFRTINVLGSYAHTIEAFMVGYLLWSTYALDAVAIMPNQLRFDEAIGTLGEIFVNAGGLSWFLLARAIAYILKSTFTIIILGLIVSLSTGVYLDIDFLPVSIILSLTVTGLYGLGFIFAGLILIFKHLGSWLDILNIIFLFFTGVLLPVERFPKAIQYLSQYLPLTHGIKAMREIVVFHKPFSSLVTSNCLFLLFLNSSVYFLCGVLIFNLLEKKAKELGIIGHY